MTAHAPSGCAPRPSACLARRRARPPPVPAPVSGAARRGRAWRANRSFRPRTRSAHSKAHRRPTGSRAWPRRAASAIAWRISAEPMPASFSDGLDGERPEQKGCRTALAQRHIPQPHGADDAPDASRATKARPSDGRRPRRSFSDDFFRRPGPWRDRAGLARRDVAAVSATMTKAPQLPLGARWRRSGQRGSVRLPRPLLGCVGQALHAWRPPLSPSATSPPQGGRSANRAAQRLQQ